MGNDLKQVDILGAVIFRQRRGHRHRQAILSRPIHELAWYSHPQFLRNPRRGTPWDTIRPLEERAARPPGVPCRLQPP